MGKKLPKSRKHKKIKFVDPCYSGQPRMRKKFLPNEPPKKEDYQEVPRYAEEIMNMKNQVKANKLKRKRKKKKIVKDDFIVVQRDRPEGDIRGSTKPLKSVPNVVKQKKNESEERFFSRLQRMVDTAIAEAKVEQKYDIELVNVNKKGNAEYVTAPKEISEKKQEKRKKAKQKDIEKKKMKAENSKFDLQREIIEFGDVAMAPPIFTAKPRKAPEIGKAGKKQLHLNTVLESNKKEEKRNPAPLSTKLKNMAPEKRKIIENERLRAVQMYRMLKNKKLNS